MTTSIELVLLKCARCGAPLPAEEDEVAWECGTCGAGWQLDEAGVSPLTVQWAAPRNHRAVTRWLPFWVFTGRAHFRRRDSYSGRMQPEKLWNDECRFYIPAFTCELPMLEALGADLTRQQVQLQPAQPAGPLKGCTLLPGEARRALEFVVLTIEADRKDKLRFVEFDLDLSPAELWVVPFEGERIGV